MFQLGIVMALESEASSILSNPAYQWRKEGQRLYRSAAYPLRLIVCGVGKAYAAWAYTLLSTECQSILSLGTSGGLSNEKIGSIYRVGEFVEHDMCVESLGFAPGLTPYEEHKDPVLRPSSPSLDALIERACAKAGLSCLSGRALSGDEFLCEPQRAAAKRDIFSAQLVDMESAAMAKLALTREAKPFAALRVVSDNANHDSGGDWKASLALAAQLFDSFLLWAGRLAAEGF